MGASFHKPSGLQIYCFSSLANRQINLIRVQPPREKSNQEIFGVSSWVNSPQYRTLPISWAELCVHKQHLQLLPHLSQDIFIAIGGPKRVLPESSHPAIIGTAKQTPQGVSVSWCEWGNWMSNPRHEHPTKRAESDGWSLFRGNQRMPNNARDGGLWMRHRNSKQHFIGTEKTGKLPSVSETVLLPTVVLWHPS